MERLLPGTAGRGNRELLCNGRRVSVCKMESDLEMGSTTVEMYLTPLNCTSESGQDGTFYAVYILLQLKKR